VLCVTPNFGPGGAERQASILLPGLRRRGVDARALALDGAGPFVATLQTEGVPVEVLNMRHRFDFAPLVRSSVVRTFRPDVVLSHSVSGAYVGEMLARLRGAVHLHNDHRGIGVDITRRRAAMLDVLGSRLGGVIAVSADQREVWLGRGCSPDRLVVIPNGVQLERPQHARDEVRHELEIPASAVVAIFVGSLRPVKRAPDFVRAVLAARRRCPDLVGVIVGDGSERGSVEIAAGGDPAIRLLGHRDDVPRLLSAADLLVLTSAHEAMPMAILEAMAAGLPVLATRVGGVPDVVAHGETGLLVPASDAGALSAGLVRLATDRELRLAMGRAGAERCRERWDSETMIDTYLEVMERAAARRGRAERRGRAARRGRVIGQGATARRGPRRSPLTARLAQTFLDELDRRGWVTWEQSDEEASVLTVVNVWPEPDAPARAPFVRVSVHGLAAAGVKHDLLYVRGYRGAHCYLLGCAAMALLPLARPGKYSLVHSHAGETAFAARFFWGAPVLATYWGSDLQGLGGQGDLRSKARFAISSRIQRLHAAAMTATTTKTKQMEALLPRRARARNWVIPDGIDVSRFSPVDRSEARAALGWPPDQPTIITVGRRSPEKRLWLAEEAAGLAAREIETLRWLPISNVAPEEMPLYYNAADLLLHTAASEGSPNVVKEAMACNLPVLATAVGDIADLLADVDPSATCDADPDALAREIVRLLRDGRRSNGREHAGALRVEVATAKLLDCYRSLGVTVNGSARALLR
jgi:glycosyltransferase involved in cell wall biosynthesis